MRPIVLTIATLSIAAHVSAQSYMDHCILYAPLDESQPVAIPAGADIGFHGDESPMYSQGKKGTGLVFDSEGLSVRGLSILSEGLINGETGTISFWMKPLTPYNDNKKRFFFYASVSDAQAVFIDQKQSFFFQTKRENQWISPNFNFDWFKKPQWSPESWYHMAITWGPDQPTAFYLNGNLMAKQEVNSSISFAPGQVAIGCRQNGVEPADALLDEFYIFDTVLTPEDISQLVKSDQ